MKNSAMYGERYDVWQLRRVLKNVLGVSHFPEDAAARWPTGRLSDGPVPPAAAPPARVAAGVRALFGEMMELEPVGAAEIARRLEGLMD